MGRQLVDDEGDTLLLVISGDDDINDGRPVWQKQGEVGYGRKDTTAGWYGLSLRDVVGRRPTALVGVAAQLSRRKWRCAHFLVDALKRLVVW